MNSDFKDLLRILNDHKVEYLIVGGYALVEYSEPRFTKDLDLWVGISQQNAGRLIDALREFGAPLFGADTNYFTQPGNVLQLGLPPSRIDIVTSIDGVEFEQAFARKAEIDFDGAKAFVISLQDLITNKESTPRQRDKQDAQLLRKVQSKKKS